MAQRNPIFQPATQDNCYPQLPQVEQELNYPAFISNDLNQVMPQTPSYQYEHVHRLQQPNLPFFTMENPQPYCIPVQQTLKYPPSRFIQRKNRNVPFQYQFQDAKRLRIDGQPNSMQPYQTNVDMQTQQIYYQPMSQTSITKYPLDTQTPANSSPSRSPILNTSVSPSSTRDPFEEVKCFHHRHQPVTPAPISQTCFRPANRYSNLSPQSSFAPLQVPAESTTSSPLPLQRDEGETVNDPVSTRRQLTGVLETILIPDEDVNPLESEIVIVSVKSPTVPSLERTVSPLFSSPHAPSEESEAPYQPYPHRGLPLQQPQLQPTQIPTAFSVHNNILDQNHFTQDYEYYPYPANNIPCTTPLQAYLTTDQQYTIPMYPRPGTPTPFNPCPPQILTRGPLHRRMTRPYDYTYAPAISPNFHGYNHFEEQHGFILHHISQPHTPSRPKRQGLTKTELKKLKVRKYKLAESKEIDESCVICMDEYKDGDKLYVLGCSHEYHRDCVKDWLVKQRNCPLCRKEVTP